MLFLLLQKSYTVYQEEYYDYIGNRGVIITTRNGRSMKAITDFTTYSVHQIDLSMQHEMNTLKVILLVNWCLTPTLAVFQLYRGIYQLIHNTYYNISATSMLWNKLTFLLNFSKDRMINHLPQWCYDQCARMECGRS